MILTEWNLDCEKKVYWVVLASGANMVLPNYTYLFLQIEYEVWEKSNEKLTLF